MSKTFTYALLVIGVYILIIATGGNSSTAGTGSDSEDKKADKKKKEENVKKGSDGQSDYRYNNDNLNESYFNAYTT